MLKDNLLHVTSNICKACERSSTNAADVTLIAVSKTKPPSDIKQIYDEGIRDFGENTVQEIVDKYEELPKDIRWHMIGHLQRNKVKYIIDRVALIHSVDSLRLAEQIEKEACKAHVHADILVQVNIANEQTKFGIDASEIQSLIREIAKLPHVHIKGLMTIAPFVDDAEENREYFRKMKQLCIDIKSNNIDNVSMDILSMGMTGDYEIAIEEGATAVRVGTAIFNSR